MEHNPKLHSTSWSTIRAQFGAQSEILEAKAQHRESTKLEHNPKFRSTRSSTTRAQNWSTIPNSKAQSGAQIPPSRSTNVFVPEHKTKVVSAEPPLFIFFARTRAVAGAPSAAGPETLALALRGLRPKHPNVRCSTVACQSKLRLSFVTSHDELLHVQGECSMSTCMKHFESEVV